MHTSRNECILLYLKNDHEGYLKIDDALCCSIMGTCNLYLKINEYIVKIQIPDWY